MKTPRWFVSLRNEDGTEITRYLRWPAHNALSAVIEVMAQEGLHPLDVYTIDVQPALSQSQIKALMRSQS